MKAIKTSFLGPTDTKPSRIKASAEGVTSKIYQAYGFSHEAAALAFCEFHGWGKNLAHGQLDADTWVHCFVPERAPKLVLGGKAEALPETDNQKIQAFLDWKNNFLTIDKFAEHYGFTHDEACDILSAGRALHSGSSKQK